MTMNLGKRLEIAASQYSFLSDQIEALIDHVHYEMVCTACDNRYDECKCMLPPFSLRDDDDDLVAEDFPTFEAAKNHADTLVQQTGRLYIQNLWEVSVGSVGRSWKDE